MKFLILTQYFPPEIGAAQTRLAALARGLTDAGHSVEVVTGLPNHPRGEIYPEYRGRWYHSEEVAGVRIHRMWVYASVGAGLRRIANYASFAITALVGLIRSQRPDWIFVESPPLTVVLPALLCARLRGIRLIVNVSDLWPDSIRALGLSRSPLLIKILENWERIAYARADVICTVTEGTRWSLKTQKHVPGSKIILLPNGVDPDVYRPQSSDIALKRELGIENRRAVLYAGTMGFAQGLDQVLGAAEMLEREDVHFLLLGDGSEKARLVQLARKLKLRNVRFLDPVGPAEVPRYFSIAECGLAPQRDAALLEGNRPAKILPIMSCSKPVIFAGRGEGARLIVESGGGVVVAPENPAALADAIRMICANPSLACEMGRRGRSFAVKHFAWDALVREWLSAFDAFGGCDALRQEANPQRATKAAAGPAMNESNSAQTISDDGNGTTLSGLTSRAVELERIRRAYARRARDHHAERYSQSERSNALRMDEVKRLVARALTRDGATPVANCRILDVGCGEGQWLHFLAGIGAQAENLTGIDLLPERVEMTRMRCSPLINLKCGDASRLPFEDERFDVLLAFTVFSSILNPALKVAVAAEMQRVLRSAGVILWHDLRVNNPRNRDVRGISRNELMRLFSSWRVTLVPTTLAPPISRVLSASARLHMQLSRVRVLCTHYFGLIEKP